MSDELRRTAAALVAEGKGILAADESNGTMDKRLDAAGVEPSEETRRALRELLFTADDTAAHISGVILYDETFRQSTADGKPFPALLQEQGIVPGIKVDTGAKPLAGAEGEKVTEGLDGLRERLKEYYDGGARFAKWRAVIAIDDDLPSPYCVHVNAHALARYAALCQEASIVPIVEPEVLMDGDHTIDRSEEVTSAVLATVFGELRQQGVLLEGILLKPNMVLAGYECSEQPDDDEVADRTLRTLRRRVPAAVPGIVFLSGGQSDEDATKRLNLMNRRGPQPWEVSFSYGRGLQAAALQTWRGDAGNVAAAQAQYRHRARCTGAARRGTYSAELERELVMPWSLVSVELENNVLTIAGERKTEHERQHEGYYRLERATGSFSRALSEADGVEATFDNGVLTVRIPKPAQVKPRKVKIGVGAGQPETIGQGA